jgi:hypothetical protein
MPEETAKEKTAEKKEDRVRFPLRMAPDTANMVKAYMMRARVGSQNEFIEKAIRWYCGYLAGKDGAKILSDSVVKTIRGALDDNENQISRLLFKLAVELSLTMHVVAADKGVGDIPLSKLRGKCVEDVKRTLGSVNMEKINEYQNGWG